MIPGCTKIIDLDLCYAFDYLLSNNGDTFVHTFYSDIEHISCLHLGFEALEVY